MDAALAVLKKTSPSDAEKVLAGIQVLLSQGNKETINGLSRQTNGMIPFRSFDNVPDGDEEEEKPFLLCSFNQTENNSYRSPWTNRYYTDLKAAKFQTRDIPPEEQGIRTLERNANEVWESYVRLYYGHDAISSVFLKSKGTSSSSGDIGSFEGIFGVQKVTDSGGWNSVHLVTVDEPSKADKTCGYSIESAVTTTFNIDAQPTDLGCSMQKETSKTCKVRFASLSGSHLENLGRIIEDVEIEFRSRMERVDVPKTTEVIECMYKKDQISRTAHLISGGQAPAGVATGMGVGSGMIGEIANRAKSKGLGSAAGGAGNPFMAALNSKLKEQNASKQKGGDDGDGKAYNALKAGLKKREPTASAKPANDAPTPEFMNFRNKLKKSSVK
mmetsp:Transcript_8227/g.22330  ORF Transcript_8227/g.22330 Transcript_8227/m.22330 type:complete len:386 (-) Transcript_8227:442-1599(-)|eukprot:CAMPEP_0198126842 /NCGR_PEP_ID=MMETSP1442-20131203/45895_1 /TAXON_ID= /ORGANISM="Craspedostauros australis, Strain CCMP3328" /LENGTH=385 /DNA_ID=CAMNT_0043786731 /DNA_START=53 /DNA_END=1210 /DNA_ORIENTATION=-